MPSSSATDAAVQPASVQDGADNTLKNAARDGAEWAWVARGDTCAFCIMLASNGWQRASKATRKLIDSGGHAAKHIHNNCDCEFAVRFDGESGVAGNDPDRFRAMYDNADGRTWQDKVNAMRREQYAANRDEINAQKQAAYARRKEERKASGSIIKLANPKKSATIEMRDVEVSIHAIDRPIEQRNTGKGKPSAITHYDVDLNNRQKELLEQLPEFNSSVVVSKNNVGMIDLSALTAKTGDEFAMFTKGRERLIVRGNQTKVDITKEDALNLAREGYVWSGHTHPGTDFNCLQASDGDMQILECFKQDRSVIYNSIGERLEFWKE